MAPENTMSTLNLLNAHAPPPSHVHTPQSTHLSAHDIHKVGSQHKRGSLPFDARLGLDPPEEVTEINVEEVPAGGHHDVVVVPITDAL